MPRTPPSPNTPTRRLSVNKGVVRAIYAVTGVVDEVQDLIVPGAFSRTLATRRVKAAWHHEWKDPVGTVLDVEEWLPGDPRFASIPGGLVWPREAGALVATVQYNLRTTRGRDTYEQVKQWHENGEAQFSIGYKVVTGGASKRHDGVRIIHDLDLYEISPVLHGAHPMTRSLEVKATGLAGEGLERKATWSAVELKAAETATGRGAMVALRLPADVAAQLAQPDGTPAEHLHITLAYLGDAAALGGGPEDLRDTVASAVSGRGPLNGTVGGIGRFPDTGDGEPTWVPVDVPGLAELRQRIVEALGTSVYADKVRTEHGFTPHITLGYDLPDVPPVAATPVAFDQVAIVRGPDTVLVPLGVAPAAAPLPTATGATPAVPQQMPPAPPAPVEAKSAAQIVIEAKSARLPASSVGHTTAYKSAAQIVLEAKSAHPLPEKPMHAPLPVSYEQLRSRLGEAARALLAPDDDELFVAIEATYPDRVIVSLNARDQTTTYAIPYTVTGRDIDLGTPTPVELTTVALPITGDSHAVEGDEVIDARFIQPTAAALQDATALIEVSGARSQHLQHLKPTISNLLTSLAKKGLPMTEHEEDVPKGSSLNLWDSEYEITDGWDDDDEEQPAEGAEAPAAAGVPSGNAGAEEAVPDRRAVPDDEDREDDPEADKVRLDADEVKAMLAALTL
ncbi:HK97 family phage prohead protease (plasmid) [Streptomyces sp. NBC_00536]|uniref:HK97 family phage prohead protease n=1 Tax=Streptomyces sp. NBC_00536 TaxID=2975769 RepID=UPI002E81BFFE|nr:2'-5' RNA ligase family protein [Streptomyces sp. NBC_00536]WUC84444.1 HK97 family phage prohead protease [Streptomyces sp. NBC_00536]